MILKDIVKFQDTPIANFNPQSPGNPEEFHRANFANAKFGIMRGENRLVRLLANPYLSARQAEGARFLLSGSPDERLFLLLVKKEGIAALAYHHFKELELLTFFSEGIVEELRQVYYRYATRNMFLAEKIKFIAGIFKKENISLIALKGIVFCQEAYPNISLRSVTDVDFLVHRNDVARADELLRKSGFRLAFNSRKRLGSRNSALNSCIYTDAEESFSLHLHWHLINCSWPFENLVERMDMDRIWNHIKTISLDGFDMPVLEPHHLLIFLSYHCFQHFSERLILFSDIAAVLNRYKDTINFEHLKKESDIFGLSFVVYHCLFLTSRLLEIEIPGLDIIKPKNVTLLQRILVPFLKSGIRNYILYYLVYLSLQNGIKGNAKFIYKTIAGIFQCRQNVVTT